jgi:hypothetical protein
MLQHDFGTGPNGDIHDSLTRPACATQLLTSAPPCPSVPARPAATHLACCPQLLHAAAIAALPVGQAVEVEVEGAWHKAHVDLAPASGRLVVTTVSNQQLPLRPNLKVSTSPLTCIPLSP